VPARLYGAPQLSGAIAGVVGVAANLLQWHAKFQLESLLEACGDALRALVMCSYMLVKDDMFSSLRAVKNFIKLT
jgi:hypothetical protein